MAYPEQTRRFGFAAKEETTYGTDATPTFAANAIRLESRPTIVEEPMNSNTREEAASGGLGNVPLVSPTGYFHRITARAMGLGAGTAYSASDKPNIDPLLVTAFSSTVDTTTGSETVTYSLSDAPATGVSVYTEVAGKKYVTRGAVIDTLNIEMNAGQPPVWEFQLVGIGDKPAEQSLEAATYSTVAPPVWNQTSSLSLGSYASPVTRSMELSFSFSPAGRGDANATSAHQGYRITAREITARVTIEAAAISTFDPWNEFRNATLETIDTVCGATQYERWKLDIDDARPAEPIEHVDGDGLELITIPYTIYTPASGNECDIIWD